MNIKSRLTVMILVAVVIGLFTQARFRAPKVWAANGEGVKEQIKLPCASYAAPDPEPPQETTRVAKRGDIATGAVIDTRGSSLRLNIKPCEAQPFVVVFSQPYSRSTRGQKNCAGQNVTIEQIQQN